jgi:hypothetical protein
LLSVDITQEELDDLKKQTIEQLDVFEGVYSRFEKQNLKLTEEEQVKRDKLKQMQKGAISIKDAQKIFEKSDDQAKFKGRN